MEEKRLKVAAARINFWEVSIARNLFRRNIYLKYRSFGIFHDFPFTFVLFFVLYFLCYFCVIFQQSCGIKNI